jgi:hypothetical protein
MTPARPCKRCGKTISFLTTRAGKHMPVDSFTTITILTEDGDVMRGWIPHWATCPDAAAFRQWANEQNHPAAELGYARAMRLIDEIRAYGGDPARARFDRDPSDPTLVRVTCPRVGSGHVDADPQQRLDLDSPRRSYEGASPDSGALVGSESPNCAPRPSDCGRED